MAVVEHGDEPRDVARIVLEVAVGGDDDAAARVIEPGRERGCLPEVPPETNDAETRIVGLKPLEDLKRVVGAAIVDHDDFIRAAGGGQRLGQLRIELFERRGLVSNRNDDAQVGVHAVERENLRLQIVD